MTTDACGAGKAALNTDVWRLWVREYGAQGAIDLAFSAGYDRDEILRVNREVLAAVNGEAAALLSARGGGE